VPVAAMLAGVVHQPLDFALGEIASFNCQIYDVGVRFLDLDFIGVKRSFSTSSDRLFLEQSIPMEKLPARPPEDRPRDRTEGAKAAREGCGYFEGG